MTLLLLCLLLLLKAPVYVHLHPALQTAGNCAASGCASSRDFIELWAPWKVAVAAASTCRLKRRPFPLFSSAYWRFGCVTETCPAAVAAATAAALAAVAPPVEQQHKICDAASSVGSLGIGWWRVRFSRSWTAGRMRDAAFGLYRRMSPFRCSPNSS